jgi:hypothetical protein
MLTLEQQRSSAAKTAEVSSGPALLTMRKAPKYLSRRNALSRPSTAPATGDSADPEQVCSERSIEPNHKLDGK